MLELPICKSAIGFVIFNAIWVKQLILVIARILPVIKLFAVILVVAFNEVVVIFTALTFVEVIVGVIILLLAFIILPVILVVDIFEVTRFDVKILLAIVKEVPLIVVALIKGVLIKLVHSKLVT